MKSDGERAMLVDRQPEWRRLLALLAALCLLTSLGRYFAGNFGNLLTTMALLPAACMFTGIVCMDRGIRRQPEFWLLLAVFALTFLCSALNEKFYGVFTENRSYLGTLLASIFVCFGLFTVLPDKRRARVLHLLTGVCAAVVTLVCLWGLILAARGVYYMPRFSPEYGIGLCPPAVGMGADFRLVTFAHPNTVGMICEIVLLLCVYRVITARGGIVRTLYAIAAVSAFFPLPPLPRVRPLWRRAWDWP